MGFDFDGDELVKSESDIQKVFNWKLVTVVAIGGMTALYFLSKLLEHAMFSGEFWERWSL